MGKQRAWPIYLFIYLFILKRKFGGNRRFEFSCLTKTATFPTHRAPEESGCGWRRRRIRRVFHARVLYDHGVGELSSEPNQVNRQHSYMLCSAQRVRPWCVLFKCCCNACLLVGMIWYVNQLHLIIIPMQTDEQSILDQGSTLYLFALLLIVNEWKNSDRIGWVISLFTAVWLVVIKYFTKLKPSILQ